MNRHPLHRRPNGIGEALISSPDSQITLIRRHIRTTTPDRHTLFVYQALTIIGKDCDKIGHNGFSRRWRDRGRHQQNPPSPGKDLAYKRPGVQKTWRTQDATTGDQSWP
jgi:hypothetical protein